MTTYCRSHPDFEGADFGKVHDHLEKGHPELREAQDIESYLVLLKKIHTEQIYIIEGPNRLSDHAWINRSWGHVPKLGSQVANSEIERRK